MEHDSRLDIEVAAYETFMAFQQVGELQQQCLGQMFYNCFCLHEFTDHSRLLGVYEADGKHALRVIEGFLELTKRCRL